LNQFLHYLQEESDEDQTVEDGAEKLDDKPSSKRQFPIPTDISDDETDSERVIYFTTQNLPTLI